MSHNLLFRFLWSARQQNFDNRITQYNSSNMTRYRQTSYLKLFQVVVNKTIKAMTFVISVSITILRIYYYVVTTVIILFFLFNRPSSTDALIQLLDSVGQLITIMLMVCFNQLNDTFSCEVIKEIHVVINYIISNRLIQFYSVFS